MTVNKGSLLGLLLGLSILIAAIAVAGDFEVYPKRSDHVYQPAPPADARTADRGYMGRLKVYIIEPDSRWESYTPGKYYHNGFLGFAYDTTFDLAVLGGDDSKTLALQT